MLDEIVVSTPGLATILFENEPYAIIDYVVKNDRFIGLGYKNHNPLKREIFLGKLSGKIIFSIPLSLSQEIYQDCLGEVYAVTRNKAFLINVYDDTLDLNPICDSKFLEEHVKPIQTISDQYFIYIEKSYKGQYHDYFVGNSKSNGGELFYRVGDDMNEVIVSGLDQKIRGEFVWNIQQSNISSGALRAMHERLAKDMNRKNTDFRPVNSSMIQLGDTALLFDFDNKYVNCFELNSNMLWQTKIQINLRKDFTGRVHYDKISNRFFLEFTHIQQSYLIEIDPRTGNEIITIPLKGFKHIDHISVYNNRVYFLYQPDYGARGKKLYSIILKD